MLSQSRGRDRLRRPRILRSTLDFRYIAIEGPIGVGKSRARRPARRRVSTRRSCSTTPTIRSSPTSTPSGPAPASRRSSSSPLARHRQQTALRQSDLFSQLTICDYLFERDKIYAYLNLDDNELFIYQRLYELLVARPPGARPRHLPADADRRPAARRLRERERANPDGRRRSDDDVRPRAERGLQPLLLPLHRHAAAGRRDLAVRPVVGRRGARRSGAADRGRWARARGTTCRADLTSDCRSSRRSPRGRQHCLELSSVRAGSC